MADVQGRIGGGVFGRLAHRVGNANVILFLTGTEFSLVTGADGGGSFH